MSEFTKGPWKIKLGGGHKSASIVGSSDEHTNGRLHNKLGISSASYSNEVCELNSDLSLPVPLANANLIASAPDMYEALKGMIAISDIWCPQNEPDAEHYGEYEAFGHAVVAINKALAKAEGKQ